MNYIEYMSGGGATDSTTIQLPPHMETKEMKYFVIDKPTYPSYFLYPNFVKFFKYGFGQNKNPYAKNSIASSDGTKSNTNAEVSSNRDVSKFNINTLASVLHNTLNRIGHLITNNESRT